MKLVVLTFLLSLVAIPSHSAPPTGLTAQPLMRITSDGSKAVSVLSALINRAGDLEGFYAKDNEGNEKTIWLKDVENRGVTLVEKEGHDVVKIKGQLSRTSQEGRLVADYLTSAISGTREPCEFELKKSASGWFIRSLYTKKQVSMIHFVANSFFGRMIGVKQIKGLCPKGK